MSMTDEEWASYVEELSDRLVAVAEKRERALEDIREMTDEVERIEGLKVQWMTRARKLGATAQQVADAAGVSRQQVYRITGRIDD